MRMVTTRPFFLGDYSEDEGCGIHPQSHAMIS